MKSYKKILPFYKKPDKRIVLRDLPIIYFNIEESNII